MTSFSTHNAKLPLLSPTLGNLLIKQRDTCMATVYPSRDRGRGVSRSQSNVSLSSTVDVTSWTGYLHCSFPFWTPWLTYSPPEMADPYHWEGCRQQPLWQIWRLSDLPHSLYVQKPPRSPSNFQVRGEHRLYRVSFVGSPESFSRSPRF